VEESKVLPQPAERAPSDNGAHFMLAMHAKLAGSVDPRLPQASITASSLASSPARVSRHKNCGSHFLPYAPKAATTAQKLLRRRHWRSMRMRRAKPKIVRRRLRAAIALVRALKGSIREDDFSGDLGRGFRGRSRGRLFAKRPALMLLRNFASHARSACAARLFSKNPTTADNG
jgi:hypothetical protein